MGLSFDVLIQLSPRIFCKELHAGVCGGHFSARTTAHKIMREGIIGPLCLLIRMLLCGL
jgi:hypothetical protein